MRYNIVIGLRDLVSRNLRRIRRDLGNIRNTNIIARLRIRGRQALNSIRDRTILIRARIQGLADIRGQLDSIKQRVLSLIPLFASLVIPLKQSMDFELQFIDIDKIFTGTRKELNDIKKTIFDIAKTSSASVKDITAISARGIGTGKIPLEDMREFIILANEGKVAFEATNLRMGEAMDTVLSKLQYDIPTMRKLFDMLNYSITISSSRMSDMLNVLKRTGGAMKSLKTNEIATLINFAVEKGVSPETTASSLNTIINRLKALDRKKMTKINFDMELTGAKAFKEGKGYEYLINVLTKLSKIKDADAQYKAITGIFGRGRAKSLIGNFLNDMEGFAKRFGKISLKVNWSGSVKREFQKVEATALKKIEKFKGLFNILMIVIGNTMLKAFSNLMSVINPVMETIINFTKSHKELTATILKVIAVIGIVITTILAFKVVLLSITLVSGTVMGALVSLVTVIGTIVATIGLPLIALGVTIAGIIAYWDEFKAGFESAIGTENLQFLKHLFSGLWEMLKIVWGTIVGLFTALNNYLFGTNEKLTTTSNKTSFLGQVFTVLGQIVGFVINTIIVIIQTLAGCLSTITDKTTFIGQVFSILGNTIKFVLNSAILVIKQLVSWLTNIYNKIKYIITAISNVKIPQLGNLKDITTSIKHKVSNSWDKTKAGVSKGWNSTKKFFGYKTNTKPSKAKQSRAWTPKPLMSHSTQHSKVDISFKGSGVRDIKVAKVRANNINVTNTSID